MPPFKSHPDPATWDDYVDFESTSWPKKERRRYWIIPSVCFNCESACGILAYVDKEKRSEEHTSELQSRLHLVCRLLLEKKKKKQNAVTESATHLALQAPAD